MKNRQNVASILGVRRRQWYSIKPTESEVNVFTGHTECASIWQKKYLSIQKYLKGPLGMRQFQCCQFWKFNLYEAI